MPQTTSRPQTLNILFLNAIPEGFKPLGLDTEHQQIEEALDDSENNERFRLFRYARIQRQELEKTLEKFAPHVIHFAGHATRTGELVVESPDGKRWDLDRDTLRTIFRAYGQSVQLAVLNACNSERTANLVRDVVPYVVGNAIEVFDKAALTFSTTFYSSLFADKTLHEAFRSARTAVKNLDPAYAAGPQLLTTPDSPDPRFVNPLTSWLDFPPSSSPAPMPAPAPGPGPVFGKKSSRAETRAALDKYLITIDDFDAFVLTHFTETYRRFGSQMNRLIRTNLLIELHDPDELLAQLTLFLAASKRH